MAVESAADRAAFFADFGDSAVWTPAGGSASAPIAGHFDDEFFEALGDTGAGVSGSQPRFECRAADVAGIAAGDDLAVTPAHSASATAYKVAEVRPDGTGMMTIWLHLAS